MVLLVLLDLAVTGLGMVGALLARTVSTLLPRRDVVAAVVVTVVDVVADVLIMRLFVDAAAAAAAAAAIDAADGTIILLTRMFSLFLTLRRLVDAERDGSVDCWPGNLNSSLPSSSFLSE